MNTSLTWETLSSETLDLEIRVYAHDGHIFFYQCGSNQLGKFEENLAGCQAAAVWLAAIRRAIYVRDQLRSVELPRHRRMRMRYLWRR
jgi:hypothetical protein